MDGLFSDGGDFSWNSNTIFDKIGSQENFFINYRMKIKMSL